MPSAARHMSAAISGNQLSRPQRVAVVCLPSAGDPRTLPHLAASRLTAAGLRPAAAVPYFLTRTRRTRRLIDCWRGVTAGGPIALLDLDGMRRAAAARAAAQWQVWQQVVAGTRPAQPFWRFVDRYRDDPRRYPLDRARTDYLTQPRVLAMNAFNAMPYRPSHLPTSALEALQAGYATYTNLAWLSAVPADGMAPAGGANGGWLTARSERLIDQLAYLHAANAHLAALDRDVALVALALRSPPGHAGG